MFSLVYKPPVAYTMYNLKSSHQFQNWTGLSLLKFGDQTGTGAIRETWLSVSKTIAGEFNFHWVLHSSLSMLA